MCSRVHFARVWVFVVDEGKVFPEQPLNVNHEIQA